MVPEHKTYSGLVLVADDDPGFRKAFCQMLQMQRYETKEAGSTNDVLELIKKREYDLLTLDLDWEIEDSNGIDVLKAAQAIDQLLPVIIITGHSSIPTAVEATKLGAFDYIEKMIDREKTLLTIKNAIETGRLKRDNRVFLREVRSKYEIIGNSTVIKDVLDQIRKVGPTDSVVLISGESGTGKELVARQIHYNSKRRERSFVPVDSGTLVDSLVESELFGHCKGAFTGATADRKGLVAEAERGTLFLDEVSNASPALQAKLLHLNQEREYRRVGENSLRKSNVRIIAASNQELPKLVKENKFRNDLYYRLKVIEIYLPPLREHKEDIPALAKHFMKLKSRQLNRNEKHLQSDAVNLLLDYEWLGNVRELENTIERIVVFSEGDEITCHELKSILDSTWLDKSTALKSLNEMVRDFKSNCIIKAINLAEGQVAKAAEILQIDRTHLYKLINEYQLKISQ